MIPRHRKGMIVKNTNKKAISVKLGSRVIEIPAGCDAPVTSEEVMDNALRDLLQVRTLAIVRPLTEKENREVQKKYGRKKKRKPTTKKRR